MTHVSLPTIRQNLIIRAIALFAVIVGVMNIWLAIAPSLRSRIAILSHTIQAVHRLDARIILYLSGVALIILAPGLWRRKQVAWIAAATISLISSFASIVRGLDFEQALISTALTLALISFRYAYHARSQWPTPAQLLGRLAIIVLSISIYIAGSIDRLNHRFHHLDYSWQQALQDAINLMAGDPSHLVKKLPLPIHHFLDSLIFIFIFFMFYFVSLLLQPVLFRGEAYKVDPDLVRETIARYGSSTLSYLALLPDRTYYYHAQTLINYTVKRRTAIVLGDPIGPKTSRHEAIEQFIKFCSKNDWRVAFYQATPEFLETYKDFGFLVHQIGQEALVACNSFSLEGSANKALRNAHHRIEKLGYFIRCYPPTPSVVVQELQEVSDEWLTLTRATEKYFSMGRFVESFIANCFVLAAYNAQGKMVGFVSAIPQTKTHTLVVDMMRYSGDAANGTMEYLLVELIKYANAHQYRRVSLGLSALSGLSTSETKQWVGRISKLIFNNFNMFYNFKGLYNFKNKFHPTWESRYLVYQSSLSLPVVLLALILADSQGIIPRGNEL